MGIGIRSLTGRMVVEAAAIETKGEEGKGKAREGKEKGCVTGAGTLGTMPISAGIPGGMEAGAAATTLGKDMVATTTGDTMVATEGAIRTGIGAKTTRTSMGATKEMVVDQREEEGRREARREEDKEGETPSTSWTSKVARSEVAYQPSHTMRCR